MEWISVKERLPEYRREVLAYSGDFYFLAEHDEHGWHETGEGLTVYEITHWIPLPAPPSEE